MKQIICSGLSYAFWSWPRKPALHPPLGILGPRPPGTLQMRSQLRGKVTTGLITCPPRCVKSKNKQTNKHVQSCDLKKTGSLCNKMFCPNQSKSQILFYKKTPTQDFIRRTQIIAANISLAIYCFEMHKDQNSPFNAISFFLAKYKLLSASRYAHCSEIIYKVAFVLSKRRKICKI